MKVPQKIKVFAWRYCRDAFPTLKNLEKKRVRVGTKCLFCQQSDEDVAHALFHYGDINSWWSMYFIHFPWMNPRRIFVEIVVDMNKTGKREVLEVFF